MRAIACCSGGVMFIPDEVERKVKAQSYKGLAGDVSSEDAPQGGILAAKTQDVESCRTAA